jgi:4-hydroxybenzoate polyprenyltransferase
MKLAAGFFRLIRFPNLFFIALTQFIFYYAIILPSFRAEQIVPGLSERDLFLVVAASMLIAAAGYIINDYFDLNIDRVNKPGKLVIGNIIRRRWAILWHLGFSLAGVILSVIVSVRIHNPFPALFNVVTVILLWFYSTNFKKQLLIGNVVISLLTGWVVLVLYVSVTPLSLELPSTPQFKALARVFKFAMLYGGFAFIISLVREVVKDIEDMEGDARYGCKTMPIVWGIPVAKMFVTVWLIVLICSLVIIQLYALQLNWWWSVLYSVVFIIAPTFMVLKKMSPAKTPAEFHEISTMIKLVMLTGILSMLFIKWYTR